MKNRLQFDIIKAMYDRTKTNSRNSSLRRTILWFVVIAILAFSTVFFLRFRVFVFHADIVSNQNISGKVFKSSNGIFVVRLDSGSQLTVQQNPPKVFLLAHAKLSGFCVGRFLIIPKSAIDGIDLSQSESFNRQVPIVKDDMITLEDPLKKGGTFSFPLKH